MKNKLFVIVIFLLLFPFLNSCTKPAPLSAEKSDADYYTCTMHPWVHSKKPGACPVCGMNLVPVYKNTSSEHQASQLTEEKPASQPGKDTFKVPVERQQLFGITYTEAKEERIIRTIRTVGLVAADKSRQWTYVSRTDGFVQKLYLTSPGQFVEKGQELLQIYSPELASSEQEFIKLLESRDRTSSRDLDSLIESAKGRLRQWNLTDQQIEELQRNRTSSEFLTLLSPFRGFVEDVAADQGARFSMGQKLISLTDLSAVWVWAEFYQNEIPLIKVGQTVSVTIDSEHSYNGIVGIVSPFVSETQRTMKVRIDLPNPDLQLRPGMYVNSDLSVDLGKGLTVPVNAIVQTGNRQIVFLDKGEGKLQPVFVSTGVQAGDVYQILSGLKKGDRIVASGNFLIDAESQVQGALRGFEDEISVPPEKSFPVVVGPIEDQE